jgi:hypothetical protein
MGLQLTTHYVLMLPLRMCGEPYLQSLLHLYRGMVLNLVHRNSTSALKIRT